MSDGLQLRRKIRYAPLYQKLNYFKLSKVGKKGVEKTTYRIRMNKGAGILVYNKRFETSKKILTEFQISW